MQKPSMLQIGSYRLLELNTKGNTYTNLDVVLNSIGGKKICERITFKNISHSNVCAFRFGSE